MLINELVSMDMEYTNRENGAQVVQYKAVEMRKQIKENLSLLSMYELYILWPKNLWVWDGEKKWEEPTTSSYKVTALVVVESSDKATDLIEYFYGTTTLSISLWHRLLLIRIQGKRKIMIFMPSKIMQSKLCVRMKFRSWMRQKRAKRSRLSKS